MRKVLLSLAVLVVLSATALASPTPWPTALPADTDVNFEGHGVFAQDPLPGLMAVDRATGNPIVGPFNPVTDVLVPQALTDGTELFGVGRINDVARVVDGAILWQPDAGTEMTLSLWNAVSTSSTTAKLGTTWMVQTTFADGAHLSLVADESADYNPSLGASQFDTTDGTFPTVWEGGADVDESVFLELELNNAQSTLLWTMTGAGAFLSASFDSLDVDIIGGWGAAEFAQVLQAHGDVLRLNILSFVEQFGWLYDANANVVAHTSAVPAPGALISLFSGLALLGGFKLRKRS